MDLLYEVVNQSYFTNNILKYTPGVLKTRAKSLELFEKLSEKEKELLDVIQDVISLEEKYDENNDVFSPYDSLEGMRIFAPSDLKEEQLLELADIQLTKLPLAIKARIADFLWDQKRNFRAGEIAVRSYIELFDALWDEDNWSSCFDMIQRAVIIAAQLNRKGPLFRECIDKVIDGIKRTEGKDPLFLSGSLIKLLLDYKIKVDDPELIDIAKEIVNSARCDNNILKLDFACKLVDKLLKKLGEEEEGKNI